MALDADLDALLAEAKKHVAFLSQPSETGCTDSYDASLLRSLITALEAAAEDKAIADLVREPSAVFAARLWKAYTQGDGICAAILAAAKERTE
jgi:hypothetical protein